MGAILDIPRCTANSCDRADSLSCAPAKLSAARRPTPEGQAMAYVDGFVLAVPKRKVPAG